MKAGIATLSVLVICGIWIWDAAPLGQEGDKVELVLAGFTAGLAVMWFLFRIALIDSVKRGIEVDLGFGERLVGGKIERKKVSESWE